MKIYRVFIMDKCDNYVEYDEVGYFCIKKQQRKW